MFALVCSSLRMFAVLTVLTGVLYPLAVTGAARLCWPSQAGGSLVIRQGQVRGSELLAQKFTAPRYFWPRPSAVDYATLPSGASNLAPTNPDLAKAVAARAAAWRQAQRLAPGSPVAAAMLSASGSGLDPHLSPLAARQQAARVAQARGLAPERVEALIGNLLEAPQFEVLGEARISVLRLNLALDELH